MSSNVVAEKVQVSVSDRLFKGSALAIVDQFLGLFLSVFITSILARSFGADELGKYTLAITLTSLVSVITNFGIQSPVKREVAKDSSLTGLYLGQSILIRVFLSLPLSVVSVHVLSVFLGYDEQMVMFCHVINVYVFFSGLFALTTGVLVSLHLNRHLLIYNLLYRVALICCLISVVKIQNGLLEYAYCLIVTTLLVCIFSCAPIVARTQAFIFRPDLQFIRSLLITSAPLTLAAAVEFANLKLDSLLVGYYHNDAQVGFYAAAFNILMACIVIPLAVTKVFFPNFVQVFYGGDRSVALLLFKRVFVVFLVYGLLAAIALFLLSDIPVSVLYGSGFEVSAHVLALLAFSIPFIVLNRLGNYVLLALHQDANFFYVTLTGLCVNLGLNLLWIPEYSIQGAAVSTIVSEAVVMLLSLWMLYRTLKKFEVTKSG